MYKLLHWLFGWHYVAVEFASRHNIRRVRHLPSGKPYVMLYGHLDRLDGGGRTRDRRKYIPLTWREDEDEESS